MTFSETCDHQGLWQTRTGSHSHRSYQELMHILLLKLNVQVITKKDNVYLNKSILQTDIFTYYLYVYEGKSCSFLLPLPTTATLVLHMFLHMFCRHNLLPKGVRPSVGAGTYVEKSPGRVASGVRGLSIFFFFMPVFALIRILHFALHDRPPCTWTLVIRFNDERLGFSFCFKLLPQVWNNFLTLQPPHFLKWPL